MTTSIELEPKRRGDTDTAGSARAGEAADCLPGPRPAEAGARRPRPAHLRARLGDCGPGAARRARLYTALFWSRAPIGRLRVTTRPRAAGRSRDPGEGRFRRDGDPCGVCARRPGDSPVATGTQRLRLNLSVALYYSERASVAARAAQNRANHASGRELPDGITRLNKPHGGNSSNLTRCQPEAAPVSFPV